MKKKIWQLHCKDGKGHQFEFTGAFFGQRNCVKCSIYEYMYKMFLKKQNKDLKGGEL